MSPRRLLTAALGLLLLGETALLAFLLVRERWQARVGETPVARGRELAERMGCFGCHGPGGRAPIPNPGAAAKSVPNWGGGTWMMYNDDPSDVAAWIRDGHPADRAPDPGALIRMPAYGELLSDRELADLTAYVLTVSQFGWPQEPGVAEGREVAVRLGCFGCHGPEGRGLVANPRSFKGYVPPWDGPDFPELVRDRSEFDQWVREGISDRFAANPAARAFLERQPIPMPAYGDRTSDADLDALWAFVEWIRAHPRTGP